MSSSAPTKAKGGSKNKKKAGQARASKKDEDEDDGEEDRRGGGPRGRGNGDGEHHVGREANNKTNSKKSSNDDHKVPAQGSWVAELEEAKESLRSWFEDEQGSGKNANAWDVAHVMEGLGRHDRVCRAYEKLRLWEELEKHAKGVAALLSDLPSIAAITPWFHYRADFRAYQQRAKSELAVESMLKYSGAGVKMTAPDGNLDRERARVTVERKPDGSLVNETSFKSGFYQKAVIEGLVPDTFEMHDSPFGNANMLQTAVLNGDVRLMEEMVRLGCSVDRSFRVVNDPRIRTTKIIVPTSASALAAACVVLYILDSTDPRIALLKMGLPKRPHVIEGIVQCAIQLVNLGADIQRKFVLTGNFNMQYYVPDLDGKTAFQIASMTQRRELVATMVEHSRVTAKERAENLAHCRCGSRLPWKQCHATGIGQPPHYITKADGRIHYRVSPTSRCPCGIVPRPYYYCCWKDNGKPTYMDDKTGFHFGTYINAAPMARERLKACTDKSDPAHAEFLAAYYKGKEDMTESVQKIRDSEDYFQELCAQWGPKSKISSWDRAVYAGCIERLNEAFYWTDVHWDLDKPELLRRAGEWNRSLQRYCDDEKLSDEERFSVIFRHTAHVFAPCACVGCDKVEEEIREFQRCSRCKKVAYCGRDCQKKDWGKGHKKACKLASTFEADGPASRK